MSIREKLLSLKPRPIEVEIEAWGEKVFISPPTGSERLQIDSYREDAKTERETTDLMVRVCLVHIVEEDGEPVFTDEEELMGLPAEGILDAYQAIMSLDLAKAAKRKSAAGNSKTRR